MNRSWTRVRFASFLILVAILSAGLARTDDCQIVLKQLTFPNTSGPLAPHGLPDSNAHGSKIAYGVYDVGGEGSLGNLLYIYDRTTNASTYINNGDRPSISDDGQRVVFSKARQARFRKPLHTTQYQRRNASA
jgi:hypothetical protein